MLLPAKFSHLSPVSSFKPSMVKMPLWLRLSVWRLCSLHTPYIRNNWFRQAESYIEGKRTFKDTEELWPKLTFSTFKKESILSNLCSSLSSRISSVTWLSLGVHLFSFFSRVLDKFKVSSFFPANCPFSLSAQHSTRHKLPISSTLKSPVLNNCY